MTWHDAAVVFLLACFAPRVAVLFLLLMEVPPDFWTAAATAAVGVFYAMLAPAESLNLLKIVDTLNKLVRGKSIIVEKIVERPVEKIVTKTTKEIVYVRAPAMSDAEARSALGCAPSADRAELEAGYRRIMKIVHPDHGGSTYLAHVVNAARQQVVR